MEATSSEPIGTKGCVMLGIRCPSCCNLSDSTARFPSNSATCSFRHFLHHHLQALLLQASHHQFPLLSFLKPISSTTEASMPNIFSNSETLYLENFWTAPPPTLNGIRHKPPSGPYGRGFEHKDSLPDKTLGRNVLAEWMFISAEHYVRTWTPYTTSKVIKSQNSFVRPETWNEKKQGSYSRKPITARGLCHTEYDRKVRPQTITAKELYAQSKVLYFFFRDCHNKCRDHSRSYQFKPQIEKNGNEIILGNAGCMMVRK
jgi:hypothetical protein